MFLFHSKLLFWSFLHFKGNLVVAKMTQNIVTSFETEVIEVVVYLIFCFHAKREWLLYPQCQQPRTKLEDQSPNVERPKRRNKADISSICHSMAWSRCQPIKQGLWIHDSSGKTSSNRSGKNEISVVSPIMLLHSETHNWYIATSAFLWTHWQHYILKSWLRLAW